MVLIKDIENPNYKNQGEYDFYYEIYSDDILVGVAAIGRNSVNMLYILIYEKYRGNGFGKEAFKILLQKFKELNINKILVMVNNNDIRMMKIMENTNHKIVDGGSNFKFYEIALDI